MSDHIAKVVDYKTVGDGLIVIHAECCGDKTTHSQHTTADLDNIQTEITNHLTRVQNLHAAREKAAAVLDGLLKPAAPALPASAVQAISAAPVTPSKP